MSTKEEFSTFFLAFSGQEVSITTNLMTSSLLETTSGPITETFPIIYEGILLDYDDDYFYLGKTAEEINSAVNRKTVVNIMVVEKVDVYEEILNQMPEPNDGSEIN